MNKRDPLKKGKFENLSPTPQFAKGVTFFTVLRSFFFTKRVKEKPSAMLPSKRTDLKTYYSKDPSVIWFGHSSYLIHIDGINILVDPVFSGHASPFRFSIKAFEGSDIYKWSDMPPVDWIVLTHNHYDHLDIRALKELNKNTGAFVLPVNVTHDLRSLKLQSSRVTEIEWWESVQLNPGLRITATPARHFSGRGLVRNRSLWNSYVLESGANKIFIGGDSGYDTHFAEIGRKFGPFDLALLECGQYNEMWPYIHSTPEELIAEREDLGAKVIMPVHWGKFSLAMHPWDEPIRRFVTAAETNNVQYTVPMIGEPVIIGQHYPKADWWNAVG
jgi:L-ascorbate metabolism protein UlaG (beta-lactamase superfamily)